MKHIKLFSSIGLQIVILFIGAIAFSFITEGIQNYYQCIYCGAILK